MFIILQLVKLLVIFLQKNSYDKTTNVLTNYLEQLLLVVLEKSIFYAALHTENDTVKVPKSAKPL